MVVENRLGTGGNIVSEAAASAAPDGYTLYLAAHPPFTLNPMLFSRAPYDAVRDFAPIALVGSQWFVLVVHPSVPARSMQELVAHVKANPGKLMNFDYPLCAPGSFGADFFRIIVEPQDVVVIKHRYSAFIGYVIFSARDIFDTPGARHRDA